VSQMLLAKRGGGRCAAHEILVGTPAVRNLIREAKTHQVPSVIQVGGRLGMQSMEAALVQLVRDGKVDAEAAHARMPGSEVLAQLARQAGPSSMEVHR